MEKSTELILVNILEILKGTFSPLMDGEKKPLHVGEAMNLWFFLTQVEEGLRFEQMAFNTTTDMELKEKLNDLIMNIHKPIIEEIQDFMLKESVPLPESSPEKPMKNNLDQPVPDWAKMTDEEIANFVVYKLVLGINAATRGLTEAVRVDVSMIFAKYLVSKVSFSITFRSLIQKKGWMKVPPYYRG